MANNYISVATVYDSIPSFSFGYAGVCPLGTYLCIDGVPSNLAGRIIPFEEASLKRIFITCQDNATFNVNIKTRSGNIFTTIYTLSVLSKRTLIETIEGVNLVLGDELCVQISGENVSNVVVALTIGGN